MKFFKKASSILAVGVLATSTFLFVPSNNDTTSAKENDALNFEISKEGRYDVTFKNEKSSTSILKALSKQRNAEFEVIGDYEYSPNTLTVEMSDEIAEELSKDPNVLSIKADILVEAENYYSEPFHHYASKAIVGTNADDAYKKGISGKGVKVAVLDSGVDTDNPLLTHAIKGGTSVVKWSNNYEDYTGHGTKVAGALAGKYQGKPIGIAPDVDLYAVKITKSANDGNAWLSDMTRGVEWAVANKMDVINISFDPSYLDKEFAKASNKAHFAGIPIFNGAGNEKEDRDKYSNRCEYAGIYCISALNEKNQLASFSAFGKDKIFLSTYGENVQVADIGWSSPFISSGTSFASPIALGTYALYKSEYKNLNSFEILIKMKKNSADVSYLTPKNAVANLAVYKDESKQSASPSALSLLAYEIDGKKVTAYISVPSNSTKFDKLQFDYSWTSGEVITTPESRVFYYTFEAPNFDTQYTVNVKAFDGKFSTGWSQLSFKTAKNVSNIFEDFSHYSNLKFDFVGSWYQISTGVFRSGIIGHSQSSISTFEVDAGVGAEISMDYKTNTEKYWDNFEILVDGVLQLKDSGEMDSFKTFKHSLPAGKHTITLKYSKDASTSVIGEYVYVDNIRLTAY